MFKSHMLKTKFYFADKFIFNYKWMVSITWLKLLSRLRKGWNNFWKNVIFIFFEQDNNEYFSTVFVDVNIQKTLWMPNWFYNCTWVYTTFNIYCFYDNLFLLDFIFQYAFSPFTSQFQQPLFQQQQKMFVEYFFSIRFQHSVLVLTFNIRFQHLTFVFRIQHLFLTSSIDL